MSPLSACGALEDLGDRVQQRAVDRLNTKYHTHNFVFVKTKRLSCRSRALRPEPEPDRWFVAPETDAGLAWHEWWYHPNPIGWYEEAQLLLEDDLILGGSQRSRVTGKRRLPVEAAEGVRIAPWGKSSVKSRLVVLSRLACGFRL